MREPALPPQAWSFVAMEYYALALNRTFVVSIDGDHLRGVQCRGMTGRVRGRDALSRFLDARFGVPGDGNDPSSYIQPKRPARWRRADFAIALREIDAADHDPRPKWGMGEIPHDGCIRLRTHAGTREFIVLGRQSGYRICAHLRSAAGLARVLANVESQ